MNKNHLILDMWGCSIDSQTEEVVGMTFLKSAAKQAGANILFSNSHKFGKPEENSKNGYTGIIGLSESHISIHTWPETSFLAIDIFMCGDADVEYAKQHIIKAFNPERVQETWLYRGEPNFKKEE